MAPKIGTQGHVSFLILQPHVVGTEHVVQERDADEQEVLGYDRPIVDGTEESGETACHWGTVAAVDGELVNLAGYGGRGTPTTWVGVVEGLTPVATRADPAGHVFHLAADCPEGR